MSICARLSIYCLLLTVSSSQRICPSNINGPTLCEATVDTNWTLLCSLLPSQHASRTRFITWRSPEGNELGHNTSLILVSVSHRDAGVYKCFIASGGESVFAGSVKLDVGLGRPPMLLLPNGKLPGAVCETTQVVRSGHVAAMVTGYPRPAVMWFSNGCRTNRIVSDNVYQLLPSGDLFIKDLQKGRMLLEEGHNTLHLLATNEYGVKHYCMSITWKDDDDDDGYHSVSMARNTTSTNWKHQQDHHNHFCHPSSQATKYQRWHLILLGLGLESALLVVVIVMMSSFYCHAHYQYCHYSMQFTDEEVADGTTDDAGGFVYVLYSQQSEQWVQGTLMSKLNRWQMCYATYELSAIPGQPKVTEKLRLSSSASKIIVVLATDSLAEDAFLSEVLQVISSEQAKVIPILFGISEVELRRHSLCRSITAYVSVHHTNINFDIRLKQALS